MPVCYFNNTEINELLVIKYISIFKHPEKTIWTFEYVSFKSINCNEKQMI